RRRVRVGDARRGDHCYCRITGRARGADGGGGPRGPLGRRGHGRELRIHAGATRMSDAIVDGLRELPTATISDALDRLGIIGQCLGMAPLDPKFRLGGRAFTLRYRPTGLVDRGNVGDYIDDVPPGDIVVLDNAGRLDCTVWGDILTAVSSRRGVGGTVIHGVCRDVQRA